MDRIIEKKIKSENKNWDNVNKLVQEYKNKRLLEDDPSQKEKIKKRIEELEEELLKIEEGLKKLEKEKKALNTPLPLTKTIEDNPKDDLNTELLKALRLLKQKKENIQDKISPSKKEFQEINKLEAEIEKLMPAEIYNREVSTKAMMTELSVFFEEIAFSKEKLNSNSLKKIDKIRNDKSSKNSWVDRAVIVSALTLRIIYSKKIISKDWNLLIDFLTDFEAEIWERALVGLVLAFQYHQHKMGRFQHLMRRLEELRNTPKIQIGLTKIDTVLLNETYKNGFLSKEKYTTPFFIENPLNYFIPFYEDDNPILEEAFEKDPHGNIDQSELIEQLKILPYTNAQRYSLIQTLGEGELQRTPIEEEVAHIFFEIFYLSEALSPFQNIIQEYYCFSSYFPKNTTKNLFEKQQSISKTKLKDIILAEKESMYLSARAAFKDKKYTTAIKYAKSGIELDSSDTRMLRILADSWIKKKEYMNSILYLKKHLKFKPQDVTILNNLGYSYFNLKDYNNALKYYLKATELEPENAKFWYNTGSVYSELKDYNNALKYCLKATELEPRNAEFWNEAGSVYSELKDYNNALYFALKAQNLAPEDASYWNNIGVVYNKLKDYNNALKYLLKANGMSPKNNSIGYNIGIVYSGLEDYENAIKYYLKATKLDSKNADIWNNLGVSYEKLKDYNNALKYYLKATELGPKNTDFWYNTGVAYNGLKNHKNALKYYLRAIELDPKNVDSWNNIGAVYSELKDYDNALKYYSKATELVPKNAIFWNNIGTVYSNLKDQKNALKYYLKAKELDSKNARFWNNIGSVFLELKDYDNALKHYSKATELDPENADIWNNIGVTYNKLEDYENAIKYYLKLIALNPGDLVSLHDLSWIYFITGEFEKSEKIIKKAIKITTEWQSFVQMGHIDFQKENINSAISFYQKGLDFCDDSHKFTEKYNADVLVIKNLGLDVNLYLKLLDDLLVYWNEKQINV